MVKIHCLTYLFNILQDKNGKIENNELHGFVKDLLELAYEVSTLAGLTALSLFVQLSKLPSMETVSYK